MNIAKRIFAAFLMVILVFPLAACNRTARYEELIDEFVPTRLNTISLEVGDTDTPLAAIWLDGPFTSAYSSDENVVTISKQGKVTAVGEGTAYIVITASMLSEVYRYDVTAPQSVETPLYSLPSYEDMINSFTPTKLHDLSLQVDDTHEPIAAIWLTSEYGSGYSSDESVVTISKTGEVTAIGEGTAYIIITLRDLYQVYRYTVTGNNE